MRRSIRPASPPRGFSLVEAIVAMTVLAVGLLGMASLQIVGVRANQFGGRMARATQLGHDLIEQVQRWDYTDARLATLSMVATPSDTRVTSRWNLGRDKVIPSSIRPQFGDTPGDENTTNPGALGATYQGLSNDVDRDGVPDFHRYWNVFDLQVLESGKLTVKGKLVQVIVRWPDAGSGAEATYRQVELSTFKPDPLAGVL